MATQYGVTALGYKPMALTEVQADLQAALQSSFGNNINLAPESVFGQFVAIMAERHALLYQLGQSLYSSRDPSAASGLAVDNILALNNLQRLTARPTVTAPQPTQTGQGVTLYGLVLYGTPGTVIPAGALMSDGQSVPTTFALDQTVTIGAPSNARQSVTFSNIPTTGTFTLVLNDALGNSLTTPALSFGMALADQALTWATPPTTGTYTLTFAQGSTVTTAAIPYNATATQVQAAVNLLTPYSHAQVTGSVQAGFALHFTDTSVPTVTAGGAAAPTVTPSLASIINNLATQDGTLPFTDVTLSTAAQGIQLDFGGTNAATGQPATAASAVPLLAVGQSTLAQNGVVTNLTVLESRVGAPAQGTGSATATSNGPNVVLAGALDTIVTPQAGWTGVDNQLDCITGANTETDAEALARFKSLRASLGSGSLAAIIERVRQVPGVTAASGSQNLTNAAQQTLTFLGTPTGGTFQLSTITGTTTALPYNATAGQVQAALAAMPGYTPIRVTGTASYGFTVDFNGSLGGQAQQLLVPLNNSTGVQLSAAFARPPHSAEIVVSGGDDTAVAQAILGALPAGTASYGSPVVNTLGSIQVGSSQLTLAQAVGAGVGLTITMPGITIGSLVSQVAGNVITMSAPALATLSGQPCTLTHAPLLVDSAGNQQVVAFSRPIPTLIFVQIQIVTDQYTIPGQSTSGINAASKWNAASVATIQQNLLDIGNSIGVGGLIVAQGTNGLVGSFQTVPGIVNYTLTFGTQPNPTNLANIQMQPAQAPLFEASNIAVSYT